MLSRRRRKAKSNVMWHCAVNAHGAERQYTRLNSGLLADQEMFCKVNFKVHYVYLFVLGNELCRCSSVF